MLKKGAAMTPYGVASRNEQTFVWESARSVSDMVMQMSLSLRIAILV